MLHPRPNAYDLTYEPGNPVVQSLRPGYSGNCIRVRGGNPGSPEEGILIHEAPNVTWLKGCISPRPKDDLREFDNSDGNPSNSRHKRGHGRTEHLWRRPRVPLRFGKVFDALRAARTRLARGSRGALTAVSKRGRKAR